ETEHAELRTCPRRQRGAGGGRRLRDIPGEPEPPREGEAPVHADQDVVVSEYGRTGCGRTRDQGALTAPRTAEQEQRSVLRCEGCSREEGVSRGRSKQGQERLDDIALQEREAEVPGRATEVDRRVQRAPPELIERDPPAEASIAG